MSYFEDLSQYSFLPAGLRPGTRNVGWLDRVHDFPTTTPTEELLDQLWSFCLVSVNQTRGIHVCPFCPTNSGPCFERRGHRLNLGSAEIRVFSTDGTVYAAPTLIYHYVQTHKYRPPDDFVSGILGGPQPTHPDYFERLTSLGLSWRILRDTLPCKSKGR